MTLQEYLQRFGTLPPGSALESYAPQTQASSALRSFLAQGAPQGPRFQMPSLRDYGGESRRAGNAALIAGAFGLGLGGPRGLAPSLAASAIQGSQAGADQLAQEDARRVMLANQQEAQLAQNRERDYQNQLHGLQIAATDENADNTLRQRMAQASDAAAMDAEQAALDRQKLEQANALKADEGLRQGRSDFFEALSRLDPASQQARLDVAEKSGELAALKLDGALQRGADGRWAFTLKPQDRQYSPAQDPRFVALRDRARRLQEQLKNPQIDASVKADLSQQLAQVEEALGVGTGEGLPDGSFLPMTPYQSQQLGQGERRITEQERSNRAREVLQREGIQLRAQSMENDMRKYLTPRPGDWVKDGLGAISKIDGEIAQLEAKQARLRSGRTSFNPLNGDPVHTPASREEIDAADEILGIIDNKRAVQEGIAGRYGKKRDPRTGAWVPQVSAKPWTPKKGALPPVSIPPGGTAPLTLGTFQSPTSLVPKVGTSGPKGKK